MTSFYQGGTAVDPRLRGLRGKPPVGPGGAGGVGALPWQAEKPPVAGAPGGPIALPAQKPEPGYPAQPGQPGAPPWANIPMPLPDADWASLNTDPFAGASNKPDIQAALDSVSQSLGGRGALDALMARGRAGVGGLGGVEAQPPAPPGGAVDVTELPLDASAVPGDPKRRGPSPVRTGEAARTGVGISAPPSMTTTSMITGAPGDPSARQTIDAGARTPFGGNGPMVLEAMPPIPVGAGVEPPPSGPIMAQRPQTFTGRAGGVQQMGPGRFGGAPPPNVLARRGAALQDRQRGFMRRMRGAPQPKG